MAKYVTKVIEDNGDLVMLFPPELYDHLDLKVNELLVWEFNDDQTITVSKTKIIDN